MEPLAQLITPIASLWVVHNAIFMSAGFVNKIRETVITGYYEGKEITREHRLAMIIDWTLCMMATITVALTFAGLLISASIVLDMTPLLAWATRCIALYPSFCSVCFVICSISDYKLMHRAVAQQSS